MSFKNCFVYCSLKLPQWVSNAIKAMLEKIEYIVILTHGVADLVTFWIYFFKIKTLQFPEVSEQTGTLALILKRNILKLSFSDEVEV